MRTLCPAISNVIRLKFVDESQIQVAFRPCQLGELQGRWLRPALLRVYVSDGEITVEHLLEGFAAVYYKPLDQPQLILRRRTETDDHEFLARVWEAVNAKARELGWIV
jgi:hypothetical protein